MHKGKEGVELYNVIAIVVPEPSSLSPAGSDASNTYYPKGTIRRGTAGAYTDDYAVDWKFAAGGLLSLKGGPPDTIYASQAAIFISGTEKAAYAGLSMAEYLYANAENVAGDGVVTVEFAQRGTDLMFVTLRAAARAPRFGILFGDVTACVAPNNSLFPRPRFCGGGVFLFARKTRSRCTVQKKLRQRLCRRAIIAHFCSFLLELLG